MTKPLEVKPVEIIARINSGRWVVECPECHSAIAVKQLDRKNDAAFNKFGCVECGYGMSDKAKEVLLSLPIEGRNANRFKKDMTVKYKMPSNFIEIEETLLRRKHPAWRNWEEGMTVKDLIDGEPHLHFSWTAPRTWVVNEVVTAAIMNTNVRDNLLETTTAKVTTKGDVVGATAANALSRIAVGSNGQVIIADSAASTGMAWSTLIAANMILHTTATSAPTGWTEFTAGRGRYIVGTPSGGTHAGTVGTALTDLQDIGAHTHTITFNAAMASGGNNVSQASSTGSTSVTMPYIQQLGLIKS